MNDLQREILKLKIEKSKTAKYMTMNRDTWHFNKGRCKAFKPNNIICRNDCLHYQVLFTNDDIKLCGWIHLFSKTEENIS